MLNLNLDLNPELERELVALVKIDFNGSYEKFIESVMSKSVIPEGIVTSNSVRGGQPRIAGSRITVADIVIMHLRLGRSLLEIATKYSLPLGAVYSAISYYYNHRSEIEQQIESDIAFSEYFRRNNISPLQEKLKALSND